MSKSVVGLLAGLALLAAAGRVKRGSFSKRYTVYAKSGPEAAGSRSYDEDKRFGSYTFGLTPRSKILEAISYHVGSGTYPIEAHRGSDMLSFLLDANEKSGIQPFRFQGAHGRVGFKYNASELISLLDALKALDDGFDGEDADDTPGMVRSSILETLGIEEI